MKPKTENEQTGARLTRDSFGRRIKKALYRDWELWFMLLIPIAYFLIFKYWPMFGLAIGFQDYRLGDPFISAQSNWVGLKWFKIFLQDPFLWRYIKNTLALSVLELLIAFPAGIILALLINEIRFPKFKSAVSNISILPHFISMVVIVGMLHTMFSVDGGLVNQLLMKMGFIEEPINFMAKSEYFRPLYIGSGMWAGCGFAAIVYTSAISGIDPALYEAAKMDGCSRVKAILHITIPCILPTIVTMFILRCGSLMSVGYEKIILMYTESIYDVSETISTYVYENGVVGGQYSLTTAVGLFNSVCNIILLISANKISRKVTETSMW